MELAAILFFGIKIVRFVIKLVLKIFFGFILLSFLVTVALYFFLSQKTPSMDRDFEEASKILPDITFGTSSDSQMITISHLRDWRYEKGEVISREYYDDTFDLSKIEKTYLLFNPFGKWQGTGHSFFVFKFSDGKTVAVSVEARRETTEEYKPVRGVFNEYELWYAFGSAADFMTRRAIHYTEDNELYLYPLEVSTTSSRALFVDLASTAEKLETTPQFYNTITSNCTNLLADSANRVKKGSIPWSPSRLFTGYADDQLYKLGYIKNDKPFDEVFREAKIDEEIRMDFGSTTSFTKEDFVKRYFK